jgi:hypothetical protein
VWNAIKKNIQSTFKLVEIPPSRWKQVSSTIRLSGFCRLFRVMCCAYLPENHTQSHRPYEPLEDNMIKKYILTGLSLLMAASLLLAACSAPQPTTESPVVDANAIYTQAAETVQAGMAMTEAARPTATETPIPEPTSTIDPVVSELLTATADAALQPPGDTTAATATPEGQNPVVVPTATVAVVVQQPQQPASGDKCEWVSNTPVDNARIPKNASFDTTIRVKNTGTTTWDKRYSLRYYAGDRMGVPSDFYVVGEVKPGAVYDFIFPMKAPDAIGKKEVIIVISNAEGVNMCPINLPLEITE